MPRTTPMLLALALAIVGSACAPSQRRLLSHRHYDEALSGVRKGGLDGAAVLLAIEDDLQVGLHMQAVGAAALRAQLSAASSNLPPALDDVVLVRVLHDSNAAPVERLEVTLSLLHRSTLLPPIDPGRETLAALVGETVPTAQLKVTPGTTRYKSIGPLELLGRVAANMITAGLIYPVVPIVPSETIGGSVDVIQPSDQEYRAKIPTAETLHRWLQPGPCGTGPGTQCRQYLLWPRPQLGGEDPLELAVSVAVGDAAILYRFALPPGSLESGLAALFGDRVRTLQELQRKHGRGRLVVHPLEGLEYGAHGFTPASRQELTRLVAGTRRRPGLRGRPGLYFRIDPATFQGGARAAGELRVLLLGLGVSDSQIEIRQPGGVPGRPLTIEYELPPLP